MICLVDSDNERDERTLLVAFVSHETYNLPSRQLISNERKPLNNRSVMPLDVLGHTRATLIGSTSYFFLARKGVGNLFNTNRDGA